MVQIPISLGGDGLGQSSPRVRAQVTILQAARLQAAILQAASLQPETLQAASVQAASLRAVSLQAVILQAARLQAARGDITSVVAPEQLALEETRSIKGVLTARRAALARCERRNREMEKERAAISKELRRMRYTTRRLKKEGDRLAARSGSDSVKILC